MTTLFNCNFEDGLLYHPTSGFDGVVVSGGTLEVNAAAKNGGSYGLEVTSLLNYKAVGYKYVGTPLARFRQRFYLDPNSLTFTDTRSFRLCRDYHYDFASSVYILVFRYTNPNYQLSTTIYANDGVTTNGSASFTITDAYHYIETDWQAGAPGHLSLWVDGTLKETITITNDALRVTYPALGVCNTNYYTTMGSFYLDDWVANDDGTEIGA